MLTQLEWSPNTQLVNPVRMVLSQYSTMFTQFEWFSLNTQPVNPARMVLS